MTSVDGGGPERFRFLASFVAGRPLHVAAAAPGEPAYTDARFVFVSAGRAEAEQRKEVLVQAALLGAGSLDARFASALWGRSTLARRYLALEGRRVLAQLALRLPVARALELHGAVSTASPEQSLALAKSRTAIAEPPAWFGVIRPSRLQGAPASAPATPPNAGDQRLQLDPTKVPEARDDSDVEPGEGSKIMKLFENPLFNPNRVADFFHKLFDVSRSSSGGTPGADMQARSIARVSRVGPNARPVPVPLGFARDDGPETTIGVGGALYPEWDVHANRYRPQWCRVIDFPLDTTADVAAAGVEHDERLRRRLSRLGLGPKVLRKRPDGDELDLEALIDASVDLRAGYSPPEHVYVERRKLARDLGVLILLDASGSATETDEDGLSVNDHQRRAAATLAVTLEALGDRVAVYGFRSHGRASVHLLGLKPFAQRLSAGARARLNSLEPSGYTRLGAGIRHAGAILKTEAGTPHRLLLVLSDGFPYDTGYEARYAEADAHRALAELRDDGIACLCLSIGASTPSDALQRVFGSASHASAPKLADLSPRMDELFRGALAELAAPRSRVAETTPR